MLVLLSLVSCRNVLVLLSLVSCRNVLVLLSLVSCRNVLALLSCLGFINIYALRVNLSVALVAMVNSSYFLNETLERELDDDCPGEAPTMSARERVSMTRPRLLRSSRDTTLTFLIDLLFTVQKRNITVLLNHHLR